jgi:hypothetical protein
MATHTVLVSTQRPDQGFWSPGEMIDYLGPPNWKFEPTDPKAKSEWQAEFADPERVEMTLSRNPISGVFRKQEDIFPL